MKMITWDEAKSKVDGMKFPEDVHRFVEKHTGESHSDGKNTHQLVTYTRDARVGGYNATAKYNYCKECKKVRNQSIMIFNDELNTAYKKEFIYHGDIVKNNDVSDIYKIAEDLFK